MTTKQLSLRWAAVVVVAVLSACGGGSSTEPSTGPATGQGPVAPVAPVVEKPASREAAARFLTLASFGPTSAEIDRLMAIGYEPWIDEQWAKPLTSSRAYVENALRERQASDPAAKPSQGDVFNAIWSSSLQGQDQLRQRVAFALSQIFVVSLMDGGVHNDPRAAASYYDMLAERGGTQFRQLLEGVALHPIMGQYLSHRGNQKADPATGRVPDENFAREVMQLFSIGLVQLNPDGSPKTDANGPIATYGPEDVAGLAKVFTGFSFACPEGPTERCWRSTSGRMLGDPDNSIKPMMAYPQHHSTDEKRFLGAVVPRQSTADPAASVRIALDTLSAHPNVGPFIGRQLIQRFVTSNPSAEYLRAVTNAFNNNGAGVRGDMRSVMKAVLLHPEALKPTGNAGKLREPVLRLSAFVRAFDFRSTLGSTWRVGNTDSRTLQLGQTPLNAPSVFNFYRPGYVFQGGESARLGLSAPEMQATDEATVAGYVNFMRDNIVRGVGPIASDGNREIRASFSDELALAPNADALIDRINLMLTYGSMSEGTRSQIKAVVEGIAMPTPGTDADSRAAHDRAARDRVNAALLLTLASPDFLVQR